ncbi:MAG: hypothetical protein FWE31_04890 [Firmicutes bacterium]|nr:hypothetical protein [Bacillota bacterium]
MSKMWKGIIAGCVAIAIILPAVLIPVLVLGGTSSNRMARGRYEFSGVHVNRIAINEDTNLVNALDEVLKPMIPQLIEGLIPSLQQFLVDFSEEQLNELLVPLLSQTQADARGLVEDVLELIMNQVGPLVQNVGMAALQPLIAELMNEFNNLRGDLLGDVEGMLFDLLATLPDLIFPMLFDLVGPLMMSDLDDEVYPGSSDDLPVGALLVPLLQFLLSNEMYESPAFRVGGNMENPLLSGRALFDAMMRRVMADSFGTKGFHDFIWNELAGELGLSAPALAIFMNQLQQWVWRPIVLDLWMASPEWAVWETDFDAWVEGGRVGNIQPNATHGPLRLNVINAQNGRDIDDFRMYSIPDVQSSGAILGLGGSISYNPNNAFFSRSWVASADYTPWRTFALANMTITPTASTFTGGAIGATVQTPASLMNNWVSTGAMVGQYAPIMGGSNAVSLAAILNAIINPALIELGLMNDGDTRPANPNALADDVTGVNDWIGSSLHADWRAWATGHTVNDTPFGPRPGPTSIINWSGTPRTVNVINPFSDWLATLDQADYDQVIFRPRNDTVHFPAQSQPGHAVWRTMVLDRIDGVTGTDGGWRLADDSLAYTGSTNWFNFIEWYTANASWINPGAIIIGDWYAEAVWARYSANLNPQIEAVFNGFTYNGSWDMLVANNGFDIDELWGRHGGNIIRYGNITGMPALVDIFGGMLAGVSLSGPFANIVVSAMVPEMADGFGMTEAQLVNMFVAVLNDGVGDNFRLANAIPHLYDLILSFLDDPSDGLFGLHQPELVQLAIELDNLLFDLQLFQGGNRHDIAGLVVLLEDILAEFGLDLDLEPVTDILAMLDSLLNNGFNPEVSIAELLDLVYETGLFGMLTELLDIEELLAELLGLEEIFSVISWDANLLSRHIAWLIVLGEQIDGILYGDLGVDVILEVIIGIIADEGQWLLDILEDEGIFIEIDMLLYLARQIDALMMGELTEEFRFLDTVEALFHVLDLVNEVLPLLGVDAIDVLDLLYEEFGVELSEADLILVATQLDNILFDVELFTGEGRYDIAGVLDVILNIGMVADLLDDLLADLGISLELDALVDIVALFDNMLNDGFTADVSLKEFISLLEQLGLVDLANDLIGSEVILDRHVATLVALAAQWDGLWHGTIGDDFRFEEVIRLIVTIQEVVDLIDWVSSDFGVDIDFDGLLWMASQIDSVLRGEFPEDFRLVTLIESMASIVSPFQILEAFGLNFPEIEDIARDIYIDILFIAHQFDIILFGEVGDELNLTEAFNRILGWIEMVDEDFDAIAWIANMLEMPVITADDVRLMLGVIDAVWAGEEVSIASLIPLIETIGDFEIEDLLDEVDGLLEMLFDILGFLSFDIGANSFFIDGIYDLLESMGEGMGILAGVIEPMLADVTYALDEYGVVTLLMTNVEGNTVEFIPTLEEFLFMIVGDISDYLIPVIYHMEIGFVYDRAASMITMSVTVDLDVLLAGVLGMMGFPLPFALNLNGMALELALDFVRA